MNRKPTEPQARFLFAILRGGPAGSRTAQNAVGGWAPINTCRDNGWARAERESEDDARQVWHITAEGVAALRRTYGDPLTAAHTDAAHTDAARRIAAAEHGWLTTRHIAVLVNPMNWFVTEDSDTQAVTDLVSAGLLTTDENGDTFLTPEGDAALNCLPAPEPTAEPAEAQPAREYPAREAVACGTCAAPIADHPRSDPTVPWSLCRACGTDTPRTYLGRERYGCTWCANRDYCRSGIEDAHAAALALNAAHDATRSVAERIVARAATGVRVGDAETDALSAMLGVEPETVEVRVFVRDDRRDDGTPGFEAMLVERWTEQVTVRGFCDGEPTEVRFDVHADPAAWVDAYAESLAHDGYREIDIMGGEPFAGDAASVAAWLATYRPAPLCTDPLYSAPHAYDASPVEDGDTWERCSRPASDPIHTVGGEGDEPTPEPGPLCTADRLSSPHAFVGEWVTKAQRADWELCDRPATDPIHSLGGEGDEPTPEPGPDESAGLVEPPADDRTYSAIIERTGRRIAIRQYVEGEETGPTLRRVFDSDSKATEEFHRLIGIFVRSGRRQVAPSAVPAPSAEPYRPSVWFDIETARAAAITEALDREGLPRATLARTARRLELRGRPIEWRNMPGDIDNADPQTAADYRRRAVRHAYAARVYATVGQPGRSVWTIDEGVRLARKISDRDDFRDRIADVEAAREAAYAEYVERHGAEALAASVGVCPVCRTVYTATNGGGDYCECDADRPGPAVPDVGLGSISELVAAYGGRGEADAAENARNAAALAEAGGSAEAAAEIRDHALRLEIAAGTLAVPPGLTMGRWMGVDHPTVCVFDTPAEALAEVERRIEGRGADVVTEMVARYREIERGEG